MGSRPGRADSDGEGEGRGGNPGGTHAWPVPPVRDAGALRAGEDVEPASLNPVQHIQLWIFNIVDDFIHKPTQTEELSIKPSPAMGANARL